MKAKNAKKTSTRTTRKTTKNKTAARSIPHRVASKDHAAGADGAMSRELAKVVAKLKKLKRELELGWKRDVLNTYEFGAVTNKVKSEDARYGKKAVETLAKELKLDKATLYRWAKVATAWTKSDFAKIAGRRSPKSGLPLTWSHLEILSDVENAKRRGKLVEQALAEALTVVDLRSLIKGSSKKATGRTLPVGTDTTKRTDVWNQAFDLIDQQAELAKALTSMPASRHKSEHTDLAKELYASCETLMAAIRLETIAANRGEAIVASAGLRGIWPRPETGNPRWAA
ncbi:MAG: hypothetical protein NDI82_05930 [Anaeromyxobacteraceae bacterium]|nr:hypothetical protein [Anaeromyxobacteraceae bacterium]